MARRREHDAVALPAVPAHPAVATSRPRKLGRFAWGAAGALVAFTEGAMFAVARLVDGFYAADPHWLVARYAEPHRTAAMALVAALSFAAAMSAAFARSSISRTRFLSTVAAMIAGLAVCLELATTVHFNDALGEVYVHTLGFRRARIPLGKGTTDWCFQAASGACR